MGQEIFQENKDVGEQQLRLLSEKFLKELTGANPSEVVSSWDQNGNLGKILPEVVVLKGVEQSPDYHLEGDVWIHTIRVLECLPPDTSLDLKLAALFHDIGKPATTKVDLDGNIDAHFHQRAGADISARIIDRFRNFCPQIQIDKEKIVWLVRYHLLGQGSGGEVLREAIIRKHFLRADGWGNDLLVLIKADTLGREAVNSKSKTATLDATIARIEEIKAKDTRESTPPPPIPNGEEIIEIFNLSPSPAVGQIKKALERLHRILGFKTKFEGSSVALMLHDSLNLKSGKKEISVHVLEKAIRRIIKMYQKEKLDYQLETIAIEVFTSWEEDPIRPKEVQGEWREFELRKAESWVLENKQLRIIFLGPPRSGKTSFVNSLSRYLQELCSGLPFELTIQAIDLDKSRSDLSRFQGVPFSSQITKIRWTEPLASEAKRDFRRQGSNLVLGDGPGGTPDEITQNIARPANCAILILKGENDQIFESARKLYRNFLIKENIPLVAEFRSRPKGQIKDSKKSLEDIQSELRVFNPGEFIGGQLVGLQFGGINKDPVIEDTAKALLFNILPELCRRKRVKIV